MFTDNWYTANTFDEEGSFEINIPDGWSLDSTVFHNEKNEKVAEGIGYFLYKIEIGQQYNGVIVEKLEYVDYDPPIIMEKKTGKTKNGYLYDFTTVQDVFIQCVHKASKPVRTGDLSVEHYDELLPCRKSLAVLV